MDLPQQSRLAQYIADKTGGQATHNTVMWLNLGIRRLEVIVHTDRVTVLEDDGGHDVPKGLTCRQISQHIDIIVTRHYRQKVAKREAYRRLGGDKGAAKRRAMRANAHQGGFGDPMLEKVTQDILQELREKRKGGQGVQQVLC